MIRFRNPGTQYSTQIQVIKQLYSELGNKKNFTLDDMAVVIAQGRLMTAYGYAGDDALKLSNTEQESMNSAKMNAKMYAEVFRMLGWVTPYSEDSSYPLVFTYIGAHVALSSGDCARLYEQCVLGINNPTQFSGNMSYDEKLRFFKCALRTFIDLGGIMYKHELCLGPMSINDEDEKMYQKMIQAIRVLRGNKARLDSAFEKLADSLGMKPTPVDNCTRLPIAFMKSCGWVEGVKTKELYGKTMECLKITEHGIAVYNAIKDMKDLRLDEFMSCDETVKNALVRLGTYSMLERAGYDISSVSEIVEADRRTCEEILNGHELLFSPCQTLRRGMVESALGIEMSKSETEHHSFTDYGSISSLRQNANVYETFNLDVDAGGSYSSDTDAGEEFLKTIEYFRPQCSSNAELVDELFFFYRDSTQTSFYPLIAALFRVMGFDCSFSRPGDNGARWDAIIDDEARSIPIEIKSPTEEQHLSIKAIRQALENKIILLSRKTHITTSEVTSLAVGYYMPNERAEVSRLISEIKETYGYKIGVIDLKSLLSIAVSIILGGKTFDKEKLYYLEGLANANI